MPASSGTPTSPPDGSWSGCHGIRLRPPAAAAGYGSSRGIPLADAELGRGPVDPSGEELWRITADPPPGATRPAEQWLRRGSDGSFVAGGPAGAVLRVDARRAHVTIDAEQEAIARQLVTTIALPLLVHGSTPNPAVVLHAAACARAGEADVVCGASGSGKSSLLVALVTAGWQAISEDMCVVDLRGEPPAVWPGPPWVRSADAGPPGATARFDAVDKTAWDITPWQVDEPQPLRRLVFLEPAGGDRVVHETVARPDAIAALARHTVWLGDQDQRSVATFGPCVQIAGAVPASRLQLPVSDSWLDLAVGALAAA